MKRNATREVSSAEPLVSVIMNCYNSARYLREAVESVFAQSYENWEIIFWDNQSSDHSAEIFRSYQDPRLKYFCAKQHTLLGEARNLAVAEATGSWIAFLDCDDRWLPGRLQGHMDIARSESDDLGIIYGRAELLLEESTVPRSWFRRRVETGTLLPDPRRYRTLPEGWILESLATNNFIPLVAATVNKRIFLSAGGFSGRYNQAEDYEMFFRVAGLSRARAVEQVTAIYRMHGANLSHRQKHLAVSETIALVEELLVGRARSEGLKVAHTDRAMHLIESGQWLTGLAVLFSKGSARNLVARLNHRLSALILPRSPRRRLSS